MRGRKCSLVGTAGRDGELDAANVIRKGRIQLKTSRDSSWPAVSARGVARAASQIDLQLLELGDALIDAPLPYLAQRLPDLRR